MQHIKPIAIDQAPPQTAPLLKSVAAQMGGVPNILATMANSPAALQGYLGFAGGLAKGVLSAALREQIALTVAGANQCDYCASAHTALGGAAGLSADEIQRNLRGSSQQPRTQAALDFARRIVQTRGRTTDNDLAAVRAAGFDDESLVEIIGNTVLNIYTNYFNHIAATEIDFPLVATDRLSVAA